MKFTEFKNGLVKGEELPIYLFEGEDAFFRMRGISLLKDTFISEPSINYVEFNGDVSLSELSSSLSAFPFMSKKRLTVVKEFYPDRKNLEQLKMLFEAVQNDSILAILNEKRSEILNKIPLVNLVDCCRADTELLCKWIIAECKRNSVVADYNAAKLVVEFCLNDMSRIEMETQKLISYVGSGGSLTEEAVKLNVSRDLEYKIYEMTDYISKKKFDLALSSINELLSRGETPQRLIMSIYNHFRRLLYVAISDKDNLELANLLGIKEYPVKIARAQAKAFSKRALKKIVDLTSDTDYKIKSGLIDQDEALRLILLKIMTEEK